MIPLYKARLPQSILPALERVLQSGQIAGDGNLPELESRLRDFLGAPYVAATAEFSRSVEMSLRMAGVGPGDFVLMSPLACLATTMPILQTGARPVWCDIDIETGGIRPDEVRRRWRRGAKAVVLYHWVGVPADIDGVVDAARELGLRVIEDAGEALGAEYRGKRIGSHGCDYTVFSFSPVRHITTGEGAAIAFRDKDQDQLARLWRRYGIPAAEFRDYLGEIRPDCDIAVPGFHNYMNRLAGAIGVLQMECLENIVGTHRDNGAFYDQALAGIPGITTLKRFKDSTPSHWVYCIRSERRDDLLKKLRGAGVYASKVHMRNDSYSCFGSDGAADLPGVLAFEMQQLCIPCGWWVSEDDRACIAGVIREGW